MSLPIRSRVWSFASHICGLANITGADEGIKNRPCAIIAAQQNIEGREIVTVVPVTHRLSANPTDAIELPSTLKGLLGLDGQRSWIVVSKTNDFLWPGVDLRPVQGRVPQRFGFGMLPPRFFLHVRDRVLRAHLDRQLDRVVRTE